MLHWHNVLENWNLPDRAIAYRVVENCVWHSSYDQLLYRENVRVYDHSMDLDCLKKYIEFQKESKKKSEPFWNFYEYLYNNILYISNSKIIDQYEKNAHEIYNLYTNGNVNGMKNHLVLILTEDVTKSNYYFTFIQKPMSKWLSKHWRYFWNRTEERSDGVLFWWG